MLQELQAGTDVPTKVLRTWKLCIWQLVLLAVVRLYGFRDRDVVAPIFDTVLPPVHNTGCFTIPAHAFWPSAANP